MASLEQVVATLKSALLLNNEGVHLIQSGQYTMAIHSIGKALHVLHSCQSHVSPYPNQDAEFASSPCCHRCSDNQQNHDCHCHYSPHQRISSQLLHENQLRSRHCGPSRGSPSVYPYPIALKPTAVYSFGLISVIALFNFALAHHFKGIETILMGSLDNALVHLRSALKLYQVASAVHNETRTKPVFLSLAILNNSSHIHELLRNEDDALCDLQKLLSGLMQAEHNKAVCNHHFDGFFGNVMHLILAPPYTAHAA